MEAHDNFLAFIERLESMRKEKKLTPDVCITEGQTISVAQGGAGGPPTTNSGHSISVSTQAPTTQEASTETNTASTPKSATDC